MNMVKREGKITKEQSRVIEQSFDPISRLTSNTKIHAENEWWKGAKLNTERIQTAA